MKRTTLADEAYNKIKGDIITCVLEPGLRTSQSQLMDIYKLSTTPIREALQRLGQDGYIQAIPHFGYIISPISLSDVHEVYELRIILECAAVRLAVERASNEQLEKIKNESNFTYTYHDRQSYSKFVARNTQFHYKISLLAKNVRLANQLQTLLVEMTRILHLGLGLQDSTAEVRDEHLILIDLLQKKDANRAVEVRREQIIRSQERVVNAITKQSGFVGRLIQIPSTNP